MGEVFLKLLNSSITAGWLVLVVLCVRLLFRKMPKWICCLLWGAVAVRLIIPFSVESGFSLQPSANPVRVHTLVDGELSYIPSIDSGLPIVEDVVNPLLAENFAYEEIDSAAPIQVVMAVAGNIWLIGALVLLAFAVGSMIRLRLFVREAVCYKENIYLCDRVRSPFILGIVSPKIYVPSSIEEEEMDYIVAHERAHLKRKDHWWKPFGYLLLCVYWFNPLCWIAYIMLCKDIELACDEKVIRNMDFENKKEYSRVLLSCATQRRLVFACPLAFGEVGVKERVKSVLNYRKPAFWITFGAILLSLILAACFLTNPAKEYQIRITIPAGSTAPICYSDEEISPRGNTLTLAAGEGLQDVEVVLLPVEVKKENAYEATYLTAGMSVRIDVEKGAWFKLGVNMQNPTTEDMNVYVSVSNVEIRIADRDAEWAQENSQDATSGKEQNSGETSEVQDKDDDSQGTFNQENSFQVPNIENDEAGVFDELSRVVGSVGLEHAYPWNNTVELKSNADALIKMAADETGEFEIYGIMSAKYGTYGLLLNDWIEGEENWNFAYIPWCYTGAPSQQPTLVQDEEGKYVFTYVYDYEDAPLWREYILACGYETGHMELYSPEDYDKRYQDAGNEGEVLTGRINPSWDFSDVHSLQVINGNNGEKITLQRGTTKPEFQEILDICGQLDNTLYSREMDRVGYNYCVMLYDKAEDRIHTITPYKDGFAVDDTFYDYGDMANNPAVTLLNYLDLLWYPAESEQQIHTHPLAVTTEFTKEVNTLSDVKMIMGNCKSTEGKLEVTNQSDKELYTGSKYDIQIRMEGKWYSLDQLYDAVWPDEAHVIPKGETTIITSQWSLMYGKLPQGNYRIVKAVKQYSETGEFESYYLATEFEISEVN